MTHSTSTANTHSNKPIERTVEHAFKITVAPTALFATYKIGFYRSAILLPFCAVLLLTACNQHGSTPNKAPGSIAIKADTTAYNRTDTARIGYFKYRGVSSEYKKKLKNGLIDKKSSGYYLVINMQVTNNSKNVRALDTALFSLSDNAGDKYGLSVSGMLYLSRLYTNNLIQGEINPGITKQGYLCFEVPDTTGYMLYMAGGDKSNNRALIEIPNGKAVK
jgi:hypothetical protein